MQNSIAKQCPICPLLLANTADLHNHLRNYHLHLMFRCIHEVCFENDLKKKIGNYTNMHGKSRSYSMAKSSLDTSFMTFEELKEHFKFAHQVNANQSQFCFSKAKFFSKCRIAQDLRYAKCQLCLLTILCRDGHQINKHMKMAHCHDSHSNPAVTLGCRICGELGTQNYHEWDQHFMNNYSKCVAIDYETLLKENIKVLNRYNAKGCSHHNYRCDLCRVQSMSTVDFLSHIDGMSHKHKMSELMTRR